MTKIQMQQPSRFAFECNFIKRDAKGQPLYRKNGELIRGHVQSDSPAKIAAVFQVGGGRL
jgi:hypothetical protein